MVLDALREYVASFPPEKQPLRPVERVELIPAR
jgi:hypothetical protein